MTTFFISDLHLDEKHPEITACFLRFLNEQASKCDALYVLGDLFEFWIGDDDLTEFNQQVIKAFKTLTQAGVPVYFIKGNRDFLIGNRFEKMTGIKLLPDPCLIDLYGKPTLLMHGDLLCIDDQKYQAFRRKAHNPILQKLFSWLPLKWRRHLANKARQKSQAYTQKTNLQIQDVNQTEVERIMGKFDANLLIHGHTHRPAIHEFTLNNIPAQRIVLNAWHGHGGGLEVSANALNSFTIDATSSKKATFN